MVILLCNNLNIHFGNQFSSRKRWVPISRHSFQVHSPSLGRCCTMTTVTTYIWGTNSHLEKRWIPTSRHAFQVHCPSLGMCYTMTILSNSHNTHLGNQFSS